MPCLGCSCGGSSTTGGENSSRYPYSQDAGNVTEKHYGCYKIGILFSIIIILLMLIGCVPVFFLTHNNNLILLILLLTLFLIGIVTYVYFRWQHQRALQMRRRYEERKLNLTRAVKHIDPLQTQTKQVPAVHTIDSNNEKCGPNQPRYSFI